MARPMDPNWFPCGHERTAENTSRVGRGNGVRCKTCRKRIAKESVIRCILRPAPVDEQPTLVRIRSGS